MVESTSHKAAKHRAAGRGGKTEVPLSRGRRLDALSAGGRATEVERSGNARALLSAASRLKASKAKQKVLQVPQHDMDKAATALRRAKVAGTVKNMSGTKRRHVSS